MSSLAACDAWENTLLCVFSSSVPKSCLTLCNLIDCSTPGFPVLHHLPELAQTHIHWVGDAIQPSHPLLPPSPPALNLSQHHWYLFNVLQIETMITIQNSNGQRGPQWKRLSSKVVYLPAPHWQVAIGNMTSGDGAGAFINPPRSRVPSEWFDFTCVSLLLTFPHHAKPPSYLFLLSSQPLHFRALCLESTPHPHSGQPPRVLLESAQKPKNSLWLPLVVSRPLCSTGVLASLSPHTGQWLGKLGPHLTGVAPSVQHRASLIKTGMLILRWMHSYRQNSGGPLSLWCLFSSLISAILHPDLLIQMMMPTANCRPLLLICHSSRKVHPLQSPACTVVETGRFMANS